MQLTRYSKIDSLLVKRQFLTYLLQYSIRKVSRPFWLYKPRLSNKKLKDKDKNIVKAFSI